MLLLALAGIACDPELVVGTWTCPAPARVPNDAGELETVTGPVKLPWSTGFEQGLCDYNIAEGYCYTRDDSSYAMVESPAHTGKRAAAFTIQTDAPAGNETRCVREGTLPEDAVYGAWYYVPQAPREADNWNLMHIQGGDEGGRLPTLWDVSLEVIDDGTLHLFLLGAYGLGVQRPAVPRPVPIGAWVQIELRLRRASDTTGEVALYQDGVLLIQRTGIRTDNTSFQQWYVGNLANSLTPPASTLYVDDITLRPAL